MFLKSIKKSQKIHRAIFKKCKMKIIGGYFKLIKSQKFSVHSAKKFEKKVNSAYNFL